MKFIYRQQNENYMVLAISVIVQCHKRFLTESLPIG